MLHKDKAIIGGAVAVSALGTSIALDVALMNSLDCNWFEIEGKVFTEMGSFTDDQKAITAGVIIAGVIIGLAILFTMYQAYQSNIKDESDEKTFLTRAKDEIGTFISNIDCSNPFKSLGSHHHVE